MKILLTGASSFTGYWFATKLAVAGHEVVCALRGENKSGSDLRRERLRRLSGNCRLIENVPFGSAGFVELIRSDRAWDLLCHHAAEVANYKSPDFEPVQALASNTGNLRQVLAAFQGSPLKGVVLTGTVFEPDEGRGSDGLRAFSPYGVSKRLTWEVFRHYCHEAGVSLGKFVIPNPFGPFEEKRFTAYLMETWRAGGVATVRTPDAMRDNIPVDLLAEVYVQFADRVTRGAGRLEHVSPSGYTGRMDEFARMMAQKVRARTGWGCDLEIKPQTDFSEPLDRTNLQPAREMIPGWSESAFWDHYVSCYRAS